MQLRYPLHVPSIPSLGFHPPLCQQVLGRHESYMRLLCNLRNWGIIQVFVVASDKVQET